ncbi:hypothetical protein IGI04_015323 [Brassica rapa subsp. trilocularis]|uniref:Protein kinase domain-containing protein n=1 Tax=Brassica rapa subsp. trilocularis TaxID=1813537 RepID=A0ABQ7MSQ8_BRACM|nr:hypothetical protein IGI04_015323 [Brassica rapa subsp. trilocularis]
MLMSFRFPARSDDAEKFSGKADRLDKLRRTRRSLSQRLINTNKENYKCVLSAFGFKGCCGEYILKIYEVGELFEEARETLKKNVVCAIKELRIYNAL